MTRYARKNEQHNIKVGDVLRNFEMDGITRQAVTFYKVVAVNFNTVTICMIDSDGQYLGEAFTKKVIVDEKTFDYEGYYVSLGGWEKATQKW